MRAVLWCVAGVAAGLFALRLTVLMVVERAPDFGMLAELACVFAVLPYCFGSALGCVRAGRKAAERRERDRLGSMPDLLSRPAITSGDMEPVGSCADSLLVLQAEDTATVR